MVPPVSKHDEITNDEFALEIVEISELIGIIHPKVVNIVSIISLLLLYNISKTKYFILCIWINFELHEII